MSREEIDVRSALQQQAQSFVLTQSFDNLHQLVASGQPIDTILTPVYQSLEQLYKSKKASQQYDNEQMAFKNQREADRAEAESDLQAMRDDERSETLFNLKISQYQRELSRKQTELFTLSNQISGLRIPSVSIETHHIHQNHDTTHHHHHTPQVIVHDHSSVLRTLELSKDALEREVRDLQKKIDDETQTFLFQMAQNKLKREDRANAREARQLERQKNQNSYAQLAPNIRSILVQEISKNDRHLDATCNQKKQEASDLCFSIFTSTLKTTIEHNHSPEALKLKQSLLVMESYIQLDGLIKDYQKKLESEQQALQNDNQSLIDTKQSIEDNKAKIVNNSSRINTHDTRNDELKPQISRLKESEKYTWGFGVPLGIAALASAALVSSMTISSSILFTIPGTLGLLAAGILLAALIISIQKAYCENEHTKNAKESADLSVDSAQRELAIQRANSKIPTIESAINQHQQVIKDFGASIEECKTAQVRTQQEALNPHINLSIFSPMPQNGESSNVHHHNSLF